VQNWWFEGAPPHEEHEHGSFLATTAKDGSMTPSTVTPVMTVTVSTAPGAPVLVATSSKT
jgi:hypothetical protein